MKKRIINFFTNNKLVKKIKEKWGKFNKHYLIILGIALIMISPCISTVCYDGNDIEYHLANIKAIGNEISFKEGRLFPSKIDPLIAFNFGYGGSIFYPKLAHYTAGYVYKIVNTLWGADALVAMKICNFFTILISGIFMYKFMKLVTKNSKASLLSAAFYMTSPYILIDLFTRTAFAESFLVMFVPIIFIGIYHLINGDLKKFYPYFIIGYFGALNSHLVCTVYLTMFIVLYMICNIKKLFNKKKIFALIKASIIVIMLVLPFVIPLLQHKNNGSYEVFEKDAMFTTEGVEFNALNIGDYFDTTIRTNDYLYFSIGTLVFIMAGISLYGYKKVCADKEMKSQYWGLLIFTAAAFLMSLTIFPWKHMPEILLNIQFPWRLCMFVAFGLSCLGGMGVMYFDKKDQKIVATICMILSVLVGINNINKIPEYPDYENLDGRMVEYGMGGSWEYLPVSTFENKDYLYSREQDKIIVKDSDAQIEKTYDYVPNINFTITNNENKTSKVELPRLFYIGYKAVFEKENGDIEELPCTINENGFVQLDVTGNGKIIVTYPGTKAYTYAKIAAGIATSICVGYVIAEILISKNEKKKSKLKK